MKRKNNYTVTKIALIVAIIALVFSIVTLVRAIIIKTGILIAVIQVIGTAIIVAVCAIMLYVLTTNGEDEEESESAEELPASSQPEEPAFEAYADYSFADDPAVDQIEKSTEPARTDPPAPTSSRYDLSNFE